MLNCQPEKTCDDCLDNDRLNHSVILQSIIKGGLHTGSFDNAAMALLEIRKIFNREHAKVFETLMPYFPIGGMLSQELAEYRLNKIVDLANQANQVNRTDH